MALVFIDDDAEFIRWRDTNPNGYIVNTTRNPTSNYLVLHRATCGHLTAANEPSRQWTKDYIKITASSISALHQWAKEFVSPEAQLMPCGSCNP